MNDLKALYLIHRAIKYYQVSGVSTEIRDELLTVAGRAIGSKPQIEIKIARLRRDYGK